MTKENGSRSSRSRPASTTASACRDRLPVFMIGASEEDNLHIAAPRGPRIADEARHKNKPSSPLHRFYLPVVVVLKATHHDSWTASSRGFLAVSSRRSSGCWPTKADELRRIRTTTRGRRVR